MDIGRRGGNSEHYDNYFGMADDDFNHDKQCDAHRQALCWESANAERKKAKTLWQRKHGLGGTKPAEPQAMENAAVALEQTAVTFGQAQPRSTKKQREGTLTSEEPPTKKLKALNTFSGAADRGKARPWGARASRA